MRGSIALVVVGYNRPKSMRRILDSLNRAQYDYTEIPLVISIDNSEMTVSEKKRRAFSGSMGRRG